LEKERVRTNVFGLKAQENEKRNDGITEQKMNVPDRMGAQ
jgi:hypothetical protein